MPVWLVGIDVQMSTLCDAENCDSLCPLCFDDGGMQVGGIKSAAKNNHDTPLREMKLLLMMPHYSASCHIHDTMSTWLAWSCTKLPTASRKCWSRRYCVVRGHSWPLSGHCTRDKVRYIWPTMSTYRPCQCVDVSAKVVLVNLFVRCIPHGTIAVDTF